MHDQSHVNAAVLAMRAVRSRIVKLFSLVSVDEDERRREFILSIILFISIPFLSVLDATIAYNELRMGHHYHGIPFSVFTLVVLVFIGLLVAAKRRHIRSASYTLIIIYAVGGIYSGWHWGASLPATLLTLVLVCAISSILISSRFGFLMSGLMILTLGLLSFHESHDLGALPWKYEPVTDIDILIYGVILLFIAGLSWLSNREIEKSLDRARSSEKSLAHERDNLEIKVADRTRELEKVQLARVTELSRTAEFGRMSQGFFHDLMTPLTSVALHMETLRDIEIPEVQNSRAYLDKAMQASKRMGTFMHYIRKNIDSHSIMHEKIKVNLHDELISVIDLVSYKARNANVDILPVHADQPVVLPHANPIHFLQIFLNLLTNAIDACEKSSRNDKLVSIEISEHRTSPDRSNVTIKVSDNGCGISEQNIARIFDEYFTTKRKGEGTGLGLPTIRKIVESDLHGKITAESIAGKGSVFTISFPIEGKVH